MRLQPGRSAEADSGLLAKDGGYVLVFKLAAQLLQDDVTHAYLASFGLLTLHKVWFALCLYSVNIVHVI